MKKLTLFALFASLVVVLVACPTTAPDKEKPTLTITAPAEGAQVSVAKLAVTGTAEDTVGVTKLTIQLNDGDIRDISTSLKEDKSFLVEVTLQTGANKIVVTATDAAENSSSVTRNVTFQLSDTAAPLLALLQPAEENSTVTSANLTVQGGARDNVKVTKLTIQVNDEAARDITNTLTSDDLFATQVTLQTGENKIVVTAADAAANSVEVVRTVTFTPTATISGHLWFDANSNNAQDDGEPNLAERTVFLDTNNNAVLDDGEVSVKTDANGNYAFANLAPGTYNVNQVLAFGESFVTTTTASSSGIVHVQRSMFEPRDTTRIVGGVDTSISEFPFMLALGSIDNKNRFRQFCGATLISRKYVLTAAHCVNEPPSTLSVLVGTDTLGNDSGTVIRVAKVISHPKYNNNAANGYDVAVLELATTVDLSKHYTAEMIDASTVQFTSTDTIATATGWGALASGASGSARLQVVHTKIFDPAACEQAYANFNPKNFETQICAGVPEGGVDACQGDSGGPLFVRGELAGQKRWFHAGATSWGQGCAFAGFPGIWARTSVLQPWIITQAVEKSSAQQVVLTTSNVSDINFANTSTLRPFINEIAPRWQTTDFTLTTENRGFFVKPNVDLDFTWHIFAEAGATYSYTCTFTVEKRGVAPSSEATSVPCVLGANTHTFQGGVDEGSRVIGLEVETSNGKQSRQRPVGLLASSIAGELKDTDTTDPDYNKTYYVDYFDITGLTVGDEVTLVLEPEGFSPYLTLYDKSKRDAQSGGGSLKEAGSSVTFTVEAGVTYLIGVSTYNEKETGTYELLTSQGTMQSFTFPTSTAE